MRFGRRWLVVVGVLALVAISVALVWPSVQHPKSSVAAQSVQLDSPLSPQDAASAHADVGGSRLKAPSVRLDVPLGAMDVVRGVINPPTITDAYWIRQIGVDPATPARGTVYVVIHSVHGGVAEPGNLLLGPTGGPALAVGSEIDVANDVYIVTKREVVNQDALPNRADVWASVPNRLVLITCDQRAGLRSTGNNVVYSAVLKTP